MKNYAVYQSDRGNLVPVELPTVVVFSDIPQIIVNSGGPADAIYYAALNVTRGPEGAVEVIRKGKKEVIIRRGRKLFQSSRNGSRPMPH